VGVQAERKKRLLRLLTDQVCQVRSDVGLARYTSFRIGGPADIFVEPRSLAELQAVVRLVRDERLPLFILGGGSNLLVSDAGIRGVVVRLGRGFNYSVWSEPRAEQTERRVRVGAGRSLGRFVREAVDKGYAGVAFAEGIPGSVGGGLLMNAGAFGGELSQVVETIRGVDRTARVVCLGAEQLGFGYRRTGLPVGFIVAEICFRLHHQEPARLRVAMHRAQTKRHAGQPHGYPNAGSIFKNPPGAYAGRLIELAGLKGTRCGRARVSEQHASFILNTGGARAAEVKRLMEHVQRTVWAAQQVWLEPEIRLVGDWERDRGGPSLAVQASEKGRVV
jgi:UDP-N-acetylmuramate dehydrogenase